MKWIDDSHGFADGEAAFLIRTHNDNTGATFYKLASRPPITNKSQEATPRGFCGSWNNVSTYGEGVWRVVKILTNGRTQLEEVDDPAELAPILEGFGYPNLIKECLP